ncbi:hypothetical protein [Lentzea sp. CA-135723]|uniref:hypothetical protein n=1 Tax=Lentzea sp. CA-135723 TaxID=3239950 RepID=UPI003D94237A
MFQIGNVNGDLHVGNPGQPASGPQTPSRWYRVAGIVFVVGVALSWPGVVPAPSSPPAQRSSSVDQPRELLPPVSHAQASPFPSSPPPAPQWREPQYEPARSRPPQLQVAKEKLVNGCGGKRVDQRTQEGGPIGYTPGLVYEIVVQNPSDTEIVLTGLRADVTRRKMSTAGDVDPPPGGCRFWTDMPVRDLVLNLDVESPRAVHAERAEADGTVSMQLPTTGAPRKSFPYKVLKGESEVFHVGFETARCDCEFQLVVEATAGGESIDAVLSTVHRVVPRNQ